MLLVAGPSAEFLKFIQILCWIILPVLVTAVLLTVFLHYRKRKEIENEKENTEEKFMRASPERVGYTNGNGEYILFDHSNLLQQYKDRLFYNHARYTALQHDFAVVETKYAALARYTQTHFLTHKKTAMQNLHEQMPKQLQAEINRLTGNDETEKKELLGSLEQLEKSYRQLEQENRLLQEQMSLGTVNDEERAVIINRWKEENASLRDKTAEQEYLADVVEEKKAQVVFLQNQLEQRIKNLYQSEHLRLQTVVEMKQMKEDKEAVKKNVESLENELLLKQEQADKMQVIYCQKEEQLAEKQQTINAKLDQIAYLEQMLHETKEQNDLLNAALVNSREQVNTLQQQFSGEQSKLQFLTQKLLTNKQIIQRIHREFSSFMDDDSEVSPVITLRPEYGNRETEETAVL